MKHCIKFCIKRMFLLHDTDGYPVMWSIHCQKDTILRCFPMCTKQKQIQIEINLRHEFVCLFDQKRQSTDGVWDAPSVTESRKICFQEIWLRLKNTRILLLTRKQHKALDRQSQAIMFESYQNSSDLQTAVSSYSMCFWTSATCQRSLDEWAGKKLLF